MILVSLGYVLTAVVLSSITVNDDNVAKVVHSHIFLSTNGLHLDIVLAKKDLSDELKKDLVTTNNDTYLAFGWGDADFYLNTPTWSEISLSTVTNALFLDSPTLMHVTQYNYLPQDWIPVPVTKTELARINQYISQSFQYSQQGRKILLANKGYGNYDNFYKAKGSYSLFKTCNTWANDGFKQSGLPASYWTPFDTGLLNKYSK